VTVKKNFYSDNVSGAAPEVLEALVAANAGDTAPYGADPITEGLTARFHLSQRFSQSDPWAERAAGADREQHTHLAQLYPTAAE